jgi:cellulose synthase/poly-beta-1,6-N-acetylglucosamine synthase-like glycosyltransferase
MTEGVATIEYLRKRYVNDAYIPQTELEPIAICTPLYNSTPFLRDYLSCLRYYDYPKDLLSIYFTIQGNDGTYDQIKRFAEMFGDDYRRVKYKRVKQIKGDLPHVQNVVRCRNLLAQWSKPDKVFFNDHDNFNPPNSIRRLNDGLTLGAGLSAGVYLFLMRDENNNRMVMFTSFFLHDKIMRSLSLRGMRGYIPVELFGRRLWMDAVACGCLLVKREVLDKVKFFVPWGTTMSDDTAFCLRAREAGYRVIGDFGLVCGHWGFHMDYKRMMQIDVTLSPKMDERRIKMKQDGVYVLPDVDVNMNQRAQELFDLQKIEDST